MNLISNNRLVAILLIILFHLNIISAQNCHQTDSVKNINFYRTDSIFSFRSPKGYFPSLIHNFGEQAVAPVHFKTKQWLMTGAAAGITAALITTDNNIEEWFWNQKNRYRWISETSPVITKFGENYGNYSVAAFGLLSAALKDQKGVQTSLLATQAMITSGAWVTMVKILTGRERPLTDNLSAGIEGGKWYGPFAEYSKTLKNEKPESSFNSFPSGHTATAFSIATVFAMQYRDKPAVPIISYSAATLVGISRLTEQKHWASDVFVGALLGYVCGRQVVSHYNKTHKDKPTSMPSRSKGEAGLSFIQYGNQVGLLISW